MKKLTAFLAIIMICLSATAFAYPGPDNTNETVNTVFKNSYAEATAITWTEKHNLFFAEFTFNGKLMAAAYDAEGNLLGTSRLISKEEVPVELLKRAEGNFRNGQSAPKVLELTFEGKTSYYFNIITNKYVIDCNADADGVITEDSRMKLQK